MPTRWHDQAIIVNNAVIISPPYRIEDCKAPKGKEASLNQVRKILEGALRKMGANKGAGAATPPVSTTPVAPRKGG